MLMTIKEIARYLKTSEISVRTWLSNYRFEKYRKKDKRPIKYTITKKFLNELEEFLNLKNSDFRIKKAKYIASLYNMVEN